MTFRMTNRFDNNSRSSSINMTPMIDIVFLLIIFFLVVCQFVEAENFAVDVPDGCEFALDSRQVSGQPITVTVMKTDDGLSEFAVGAEKISVSNYADIVEELSKLIDIRLKDMPDDRRIVTLRIDKDVCFDHAQYALAAVAASSATDIQLAALKNRKSGIE